MPQRDIELTGAAFVAVAAEATSFVSVRVEGEEADARYQSLIQQLPGATYVHALGDRDAFTYVSQQIGTMIGFRVQDWLAEPDQ